MNIKKETLNLENLKPTHIDLETKFKFISISGEDSENFLQNQLTNDINQLDESSHLLSGYCNAKGRTIALIRVFKIDKNNFYLVMPDCVVEKVVKKFNFYKLRSKLKISEQESDLVVFGVWSKNISLEKGKLVKSDDILVAKDESCPLYGERAWIIAKKSVMLQEIREIENLRKERIVSNPHESPLWMESEFLLGNIWILIDNSESFIPQTLNLDLNNSVSFKKGCYPGQEIVARTHFLGKVKRRTILLEMIINKDEVFDFYKKKPIYMKLLSDNNVIEIGSIFLIFKTFLKNENIYRILLFVDAKINEIPDEISKFVLYLGEDQQNTLNFLKLPYFKNFV